MLEGQAVYGRHRAQADDGVLGVGRNLFPMLPEDAYDRGVQSLAGFRLVADVRLDNRPELVARLGPAAAGHSTMCDSALLFKALLQWGAPAVQHFVGEFAFAYWDGAKQELLLARDILGSRPLYFSRGKAFFAFASMPSGLHALEEVPYDFDAEFVAERLALVPHLGSRSFFKDIERVEPGHLVRITLAGLQSRRYWCPPAPPAVPARSEEYEEGLRSVLEKAATAQLRGAGDIVASHLSGGLDSSTVTATVARLHPDLKIVAYTAIPRAGFKGGTPPGSIASEADLAAATAALYPNVEHVLIESSGESPLAGLDRSFHYEQQPSANLCNSVWGRSINRAARDRGAKVLLKGALGNLTTSYSGLQLLPWLLAHGRLLKLARYAFQLSRDKMPLLAIGAQTLGPFTPAPVWRSLRRLGGRSAGPMSYSAASPARFAELNFKGEARGFDMAGRPRRDPYENRIWAFCLLADGGNCRKGMLAENGLSTRDPTSDQRVIEYTLAIPAEEFVRDGVPRSLARRAFADRLPPAVATSRMRGYQAADWHEGLDRARAEIAQEVASIARCADVAGALDISWLQNAVDDWPEGGWDRFEVRDRYRLGLMRGISAGHFMRRVRGTN